MNESNVCSNNKPFISTAHFINKENVNIPSLRCFIHRQLKETSSWKETTPTFCQEGPALCDWLQHKQQQQPGKSSPKQTQLLYLLGSRIRTLVRQKTLQSLNAVYVAHKKQIVSSVICGSSCFHVKITKWCYSYENSRLIVYTELLIHSHGCEAVSLLNKQDRLIKRAVMSIWILRHLQTVPEILNFIICIVQDGWLVVFICMVTTSKNCGMTLDSKYIN